ncbi:nucleotidyltransferase family protein [Rhabdonatronobacter sediminivivens]|uniref:nucleotidyltransferase family protein n=1 Tax=Rhabdonatronobacter sediminivivens TaxID=2743469 RepID=UPI002E184C80
MHPFAIVLPAAGTSSRMGGADKLLEPVDAVPLLQVMAGRACATGAAVAVTLRPGDTARATVLEGLPLSVIAVPDAGEGMAASLRAGARWATGRAGALMVLLPDMPGITSADMTALFAAWQDNPERPLRAATADGQPGHPVILPPARWPAMARLQGDAGARDLVTDAGLHPLPGQRAVTDLDTPTAWAAWRAGHAAN